MATVLIWNNNETSFTHRYSGHAALNITDQWTRAFVDDDTDHYVSWWPGGPQGSSHSGGRKGQAFENYLKDLDKEKYAPDHIIRIPAGGTQVSAMLAEWAAQRTKTVIVRKKNFLVFPSSEPPKEVSNPSYRYYKKNCAIMVMRVLRAGKFATDGSVFSQSSMVWTPLNVKRLALSYQGATTITWSQFIDELQASGSLGKYSADKLRPMLRRSSRHGSSGAAPRNTINWHGGVSKSATTNASILSSLRTIS